MQIAETLTRLPQKVIAWAFGVTAATVRSWDCPRNKDGTYNLSSVFRWYLERENNSQPIAELEALKTAADIERLDEQICELQRKERIDSHELRTIFEAQKLLESQSNLFRSITENIRKANTNRRAIGIIQKHIDNADKRLS